MNLLQKIECQEKKWRKAMRDQEREKQRLFDLLGKMQKAGELKMQNETRRGK